MTHPPPRFPHRRRAPGALVAVLLVLVLLGVGTRSAAAHAELVESVPADGAVLAAAPDAVELRFNEPVQLIDGAIRLFADGGAATVLGATATDSTVTVVLPEGIADGTVTVAYRVVSDDGHPVAGALTFHVGAAPGDVPPGVDLTPVTPAATEALFSGLTVLQYLGLLLFAGLVFFERLVLPAGSPGNPTRRRLRVVALGVASVAAVLAVPVAALRVTGGPPWQVVSPQAWWPGLTWPQVQAAALVLAAGWAAHLLFSSRAGARPTGWSRTRRESLAAGVARPSSGQADGVSGSRSRRVAAPLLAAVAVAAPSLVGHTRTVEPGWLMTAADVGHLLAAAFWVGGVVGLLVHLAAVPRAVAPAGGPAGCDACAGQESVPAPDVGAGLDAARVAVRFSQAALLSVLLLAASGITMGVLVVGSAEALVGTTYGRALMLKLGVVVAVVALAAWNRVRLLPTISRRPDVPSQWATLVRILRYEAALLVAVVVITGFLANSSPNHQHGPATQQVQATSQGLAIEGAVAPSRVGANEFVFTLTLDGDPLLSDDVAISARLPEQDLGPLTAQAVATGAGGYTVELVLPATGEWEVQVSARVSRFERPLVLIPVRIS